MRLEEAHGGDRGRVRHAQHPVDDGRHEARLDAGPADAFDP
jgi:hypothetical protein